MIICNLKKCIMNTILSYTVTEKTEYDSKVAEWLWWLISDCKPNTTVFIPGYPTQMFRFPDL